MRTLLLLALAGCTAQAAPPVAGGGSAPAAPAAAGVTITVDQTYAQCIAAAGDAVAGDVCYPTDSAYWLLCRVDAAWVHRIEGVGFDITPPPSTGWTAYSSGSVAALSGGGRRLTSPSEAPGTHRGEYRERYSDPTVTPYLITAIWRATHTGGVSGEGSGGLAFTDTTGFAIGRAGGGILNASRFSSAAGHAGTDLSLVAETSALFGMAIWEDSTERHFGTLNLIDGSISEWGSGLSRTDTITSTHNGWLFTASNTNYPRHVDLLHWQQGEL